MTSPKVSVLMPVYKTNEEYLRKAIESILAQTFSDMAKGEYRYNIFPDELQHAKKILERGFKMKKKVCIFLDQFIMGGVEKVALVLFPELAKKYEISVLLNTDRIDPYLKEVLNSYGISVCYPPNKPKGFFKRKWYKLIQKRRYKHKLQEILNSANLIFDYKNFSSFERIKGISVPKITFCHGSFVCFERFKFIQKIEPYNKIVCLSDNFKRDFINKYPMYKDKIVRIYNPLNLEEIRLKATEIQEPKNKYFVAIQRLDKFDKDVGTIIKAFNLFSQEISDVDLYVIGDGPDKEEFLNLTKGNPHIIFTGQLNDVYSFIKSSEALILSSQKNLGEGLPNTLLEAQALGTLAISSDVPSGPAEILMNGQAGILFPPSDFKALSLIMSDVINHKINTKELISTATKNLYRFDKQIIVSQIIDLIEKTMEEK